MKWINESQVPEGYALRVKNDDFSIYVLNGSEVFVSYKEGIKMEICIVRHTRRATKRHVKSALKKHYIDGLRGFINKLKNDSTTLK